MGVSDVLRYKRVVVKLSGEALCGKDGGFGIDTATLKATATELAAVHAGGVQIGSVFLDSQYLVILAVTMVMVVFQYFFFEHTMLGKKLQATSQDKDMARLLGIPVALMIAITFVYSSALGGLAGVLVGPVLFVSIGMGSIIALKAFAATIIGGFGDVKGAIVGGIFIGVIESFAAFYISVPYKDAYAFLMLFLVLVFRPQGFFGERVSEKA